MAIYENLNQPRQPVFSVLFGLFPGNDNDPGAMHSGLPKSDRVAEDQVGVRPHSEAAASRLGGLGDPKNIARQGRLDTRRTRLPVTDMCGSDIVRKDDHVRLSPHRLLGAFYFMCLHVYS